MNVRTLIGESVHRAEDFRFLKGAGSFVDDLKRAGMLHAVVLRSPVAHGRIRGIDARAARALPGVHAVVTAAEIGDVPVIPLRLANLPEFKNYLQPVIAKDKVRYVGEPVAVVVAETQALAEDALEKVELDIERLPALPDRHVAANDKSALFDGLSNRTVRYVASFGEVDCELEIACKRDGTILAMRGHVSADMGAYIRTNGGVVPAKAAQFLPGPYRIRDIALTVEAFVTSKTPVGTLRAPGRFEANFFRERLLDIVAGDLGLDPMDFRRKNLIKEAELPFATGNLVPYEPETEFDTGDYHVTFECALSEIGWDQNKALNGRLIDGRYHGLAAVPFVESGGSGKENSRLVIE